MSEDGLSASAAGSPAEDPSGIRPAATMADGKAAHRSAKRSRHGAAASRQRGANGQGAKTKQKPDVKTARPSVSEAETTADNVVWVHDAFRGLDLVPLGVRGLYLDLAACRRARQWFLNPVGDPPDVCFVYRFERGKDSRMRPVRADLFGGGACPVVLSMLREAGDRPDINIDEYRIGWAGPGNHWYFQPQRVSHKQLVGQVDWLARLNAGVVSRPEHSLVCKIVARQTADKNHSPIMRLPPPGLVCEAGAWSYGYPYGDRRPGDKRNPARRLYAEFDEDRIAVRNAAGGQAIPLHPIASSRLSLLADYLAAWNQQGGALATFCFAARSLCASIAPLHVTLYLVGEGEQGKTVTARFVTQCISSMGTPEIRLSGGGTTVNSMDLVFQAHRDCLALFDDKYGNESEAIQAAVRLVSVVHEGGVSRQRLNRDKSAADGAHVECGVVITANNLKGLDKCRQRRMALLIFEKSEAGGPRDLAWQLLGKPLAGEDFDYVFEAGLPAGGEAMSGVIRWILQQLQAGTHRAIDTDVTADAAEQLARERFAGAIEARRRQTTGQLLAELRRARPGARFVQSVAEAFAEIWSGGILLDRAAGFTESLDFDGPADALGPVTSRLRRHILSLALRAADLINGRIRIDANDIAEQFPRDLRRVLTGGRWGLVNHDGALPQLKGVPPEAAGWTRDPDAEKARRPESRRPPTRPGDDAEAGLTWRRPARVLGYCKDREVWIEPHLFSDALAEARDSEIDYALRDAVILQLLEAGILVRGESEHLLAKRRINGRRPRFIVVRVDRIWPPEAKGKVRPDSDDPGAQIINLPGPRPGAPDSMPAEHTDSVTSEQTGSAPARKAAEPARAAGRPEGNPAGEVPQTAPAVPPPALPAAKPTPWQGGSAYGAHAATMSAGRPAAGPAPASSGAIVTVDSERGYRIDRAGPVSRIDAPKPGMSFPELLDWCERERVEQLQLDASWCAAAGLPVEWQDDESTGDLRRYLTGKGLPHPWVNVPDDGRWRISNPGELHWWTWARRNGGSVRQSVEIAFPGYDDRSAFHKAADAEVLAHGLNEIRAGLASDNGRTGFAYRAGPAETFLTIWRSLATDRGAGNVTPELAPAEFPPPALGPPDGGPKRHVAGNIYWMRRPSKEEMRATHCIVLDKNGAYPGAMTGLRCGIGKPRHTAAPVAFDKACPGWWRVRYRAPSWPVFLPVPGGLLPPGVEGWLETGTVAFLFEIGAHVEIAEAWLWPSSVRALDRLQHRLRDARARLMERRDNATLPEAVRAGASLAYDVLKASIVRGVGWFDRRDDRSSTVIVPRFRPHWRDGIIARATANLFRNAATAAAQSGIFPIGFYVDALVYLTADPDPVALAARLGLSLGTSFGQYKVAGVMPADAVMPALNLLPEDSNAPLTSAHRDARRRFLRTIDDAKHGDAAGAEDDDV